MQAADAALAAGQRHVERLGLQLRFELGVGQRLAARVERGLDLLLGGVDLGAARLLLVGGSAASAFSSSVTRPALPR